jgi:hypothetical protein
VRVVAKTIELCVGCGRPWGEHDPLEHESCTAANTGDTTGLLRCIHGWFVSEVAAGDEALRYWVDLTARALRNRP